MESGSDALAEAGFDDITLAQARVFQRIASEGSRLTELAAAAQVTKQTAGSLVDQLERAGYVKRTPDPRDGRARPDLNWTVGSGADLHGPIRALLLLLTGRTSTAAPLLSGPGTSLLTSTIPPQPQHPRSR